MPANFLSHQQSNIMSIEFLQQIAATPLPRSFTNAKDIDAIKILRQAGLIIVTADAPPTGALKVIAITQKGQAELLRLHYPQQSSPTPINDRSWLHLVASRTRAVIDKVSGPGRKSY